MHRISILGLLLVAATAPGCMYPALKSGAGGAAASGGSAAGANGSGGKGGSAAGAAGTTGNSSARGGSAGSSAAGAIGSSSGKGGSASGSAAGATGGGGKGGSIGGSAAGATGSSGGSSTGGSGGSRDAGVPDAPSSQPDVPVGGSDGGSTSTGGTSSIGGSGGSSSGAVSGCPVLTNPSSGSVSVPDTATGSTAVYHCDPGYKLTGSMTRTCQPDGTWTAAEPSCTRVDCGGLTDPSNGSVSATTTTFGSTADYSCGLGYGLAGTSPRTCQADGTWSGSAPTCSLADCPTAPSPANGAITTTGTKYGSTATYRCDPGYNLSSAAARTCQADGTWSGTTPACTQIDCYQPAGILNGRVNATYTTGARLPRTPATAAIR